MGSALLLGPGLAVAQQTVQTNQHLDGTTAKGNAPVAVTYAAELLSTEITGATLKAVPVQSPDGTPAGDTPDSIHRLIVTPRRLINLGSNGSDVNNLYLRLELSNNMTFTANQTGTDTWAIGSFGGAGGNLIGSATTVATQVYAGGDKGENYVVYKVTYSEDIDRSANFNETNAGPNGTAIDLNGDSDTTDTEVSLPISLFANVPDLFSLPAGNEGSFTASISAHRTADDAIDNERASGLVAGGATIIKVMEGIEASVCAAGSTGCAEEDAVVAHVGTLPQPFLWFKDGDSTKSSAVLGIAHAKAKGGTTMLYDPDDGSPVTDAKLIEPGGLTFEVTGDFSIGAFNLGTDGADDAACVKPATADAAEPAMGNLAPAKDGPANKATLAGKNAGTYKLCVQVNTQGDNATPIPATKYMGMITLGTGSTALKLADGTIGDIKRNGTTVKLTYLTISPKYNQRLILVNDSAANATYSISGFSAEDGVDVTPLAMAEGTIMAGEKKVMKVADIVSIDSGGRPMRTAATLSINADSDDVQVATTQVNLEDGSTDTVLYAAVGGVEVN